MKVIIAGSRTIIDPNLVIEAIKESKFKIDEVCSGKCRGPDSLGEEWAKCNNIPIKDFPADWQKLGKKAGILRNIEMGNYADAAICLWDKESIGTKHMIQYMTKLNKPVYIKLVSKVTTK